MPVNYRAIGTAAWLPSSAGATIIASYQALPFPEHWREALLRLCNAGREDKEPYYTVPTRRIEQVMQALLPDIMVLPRLRQKDRRPQTPWLLIPEGGELPTDAIFWPLINAWLGDLRPEGEHRSLLKEVRASLAADPPEWQPLRLELLGCSVSEGGTATPAEHQFPLLTDWVARRILELPPYEYSGGNLTFRGVPRGIRDQGAELVSQPMPFEVKDRTAWFSVVMHITLHTVPFEPLPRIHLHLGIRRWATRPHSDDGQVRIPYGRKTTVLLRPKVPWLPGAPLSERFAVAKLDRRWDHEAGGYVTDWAYGGPTRILQGTSLGEPFPEAHRILAQPERWLTEGMNAAIVYSTTMGWHEISGGLMSNQRSEIVHWAAQAFPAELRPVPALRQTELAPTTPANQPKRPTKADLKLAEEVRATEERRTGVAFAVRCLRGSESEPLLEARLLWQTPEMRDTAIAALASHLGLKGDGGAPAPERYEGTVVLEWQMPELAVRLHCLKLTGGLARDLPIAGGVRKTDTVVAAALRVRRSQTEQFLKEDLSEPAPTIALVELDRRKDFTSADHDPKFALRLGCADAGVLTQFVMVPKKDGRYDSVKNAGHRAAKAWDDALRQLGVRVHPEHTLTKGIPLGMRYAAVWLVRKNKTSNTRWAGHVPVAVLVTPESPGSGLARVQGWDPQADSGAGAWIPYPSMLLRLAQLAEIPTGVAEPRDGNNSSAPRTSWYKDMEEQRRNTEEWLQKLVRTLRGTPTLLLVGAQNARSHWTWIQDGHIQMDRLRTGHAPSRRLDPDLRLMRVRTAADHETAQWWGINPNDGPNGLPSQLWTSPETTRVFWSTTPKASQFKASAVEADKLAPRPLRAGKRKGELTIDTDKPAWNPGLVELAVLGCHEEDGDKPEAIAAVAHQMRQPPDYPDALTLPLPLHLAERAQEYVLPAPSDAEDVASGENG